MASQTGTQHTNQPGSPPLTSGEPVQQITAVLQVISSLSSTLDLDEILAEFTQKITQIVGVDGCTIFRRNREDDTLVVLADYISPQVDTPFHDVANVGAAYPLEHFPATANMLHRQTPLIVHVDDPTADEAERELLQAFQWNSVLMVPMLHKGRAVGLLKLYTTPQHRHQFTPQNTTLCQILANQAGVAIENARLYQEAEDGHMHAEAMRVISRALASELDLQRIVHDVADIAFRLVNAQFVQMAVPQEKGFRLVATAGHPEPGPTSFTFLSDMLAQAVQGKRPVVVGNNQTEPTAAGAAPPSWRSLVAVPLLSHDQVVGVLAAYADQPNFFGSGDVATLMSLASQAAVAIQNAQLFAELEAQRATLHQMSLRLVNAQEEERRRISRELHDELGQALTALKINLEVAQRALPNDAPAKLKQSVKEASILAVQTLETARSLSLELRPALLDDLGLVSALRWEVDRYEQRTGQTVQFEADLSGATLPPELEITVYRIVTEALTNVARHAQAKNVGVQLHVKNRQLVATIEDDGVGFNAAAQTSSPTERQSLGLVSMRERAGLLGGRLEVFSEPGQGTRVQARLPLK